MNIRTRLSDSAGCALGGLTLLGFILICSGELVIMLIGAVFILPFLISMIATDNSIEEMNEKKQQRIDYLIKYGHKIMVNLDDFEIHSNSYQKEIEVPGSNYDSRIEKININHNTIIIRVPYNDDIIEHRLDINMETDKLKIYFALKGETELYVDPENPGNNFLDLRFLEN